MKKMLVTLPLCFLACFSFSQSLQKANLIGLHIITVDLKPNVTMEEVRTFYLTRLIPEIQKSFQGAKGYLLHGVRGENKDAVGLLWVFENEAARDQYFTKDGNPTALGTAASEKVAPINKEREKLGTFSTKYTDWVVQ